MFWYFDVFNSNFLKIFFLSYSWHSCAGDSWQFIFDFLYYRQHWLLSYFTSLTPKGSLLYAIVTLRVELIIWDYTRLYKTILYYIRLYRTIQDFARLYRTIQDYSTRLYKTIHDNRRPYRSIYEYLGLYKTIQDHIGLWRIMLECKRLYRTI